jgi:hypothetical protein
MVTATSMPTNTLTSTATSVSAYAAQVLGDNPISYWRLDETSGTTAVDQKGANTGTYTSSPTLAQAGALLGDPDTAVTFNGTSQYVNVPSNAALNPSHFTVEVWAKATGGAGTYRGIVASRAYPNGWVLYAAGNNLWQFWINNGTAMVAISGGSVTLNAWTHLVGTFDGTTARFYVNGVLANSTTITSYTPQTTKAVEIGQGEPGAGFYFPGTIDEPAVYGSVLSASQVLADYQLGSQGPTPTPTITGTSTPSSTSTRTPTITNTPSPTMTQNVTSSPTATSTPTMTNTAAATSTLTSTATGTPTPTFTATLTPTATLVPSAYRNAILADNPISYWRLDETSGTTAYDLEQANPGTYTASPTLAQAGALSGDPDSAVTFNGTSQYVNVPYNASLNSSHFTVEVWAKATGGAGTYRGVMASRSFPNGWVLYAAGNNLWQFWINNGTTMLTISGGSVTLNAWTHLVGTFDGTTARFYVNGVLANSATITSYTPQTTKALEIGQGEPGSGFYFPGTIDEPAVYGTVLSASQVLADYQLGSQAPTPTPSPTAGH